MGVASTRPSVPPVSVKEPVEFDSAHQQLAKILEQVTDGFGPVDYEILHRDPKALEEYLNHAAMCRVRSLMAGPSLSGWRFVASTKCGHD